MLAVLRTLLYGSAFIGILIVFVPYRILVATGTLGPVTIGLPQIAGVVVALFGAVTVTWTALSFAVIGKGTPAPFDAPRRLVVRGLYRYVRNPMYIGAGCLLIGAALYWRSIELIVYMGALMLATHLFIVLYEEPTLTRLFGDEYLEYRRRVRRWWPWLR